MSLAHLGRLAGVLLHPSSLPGGIDGTGLGDDARRFVDLLAASGIGLWQMLPVNPVNQHGSPYQSCSVFAADARLITGIGSPRERVQTARAQSGGNGDVYARFRVAQSAWLDDYAVYRAVKDDCDGAPWWSWPPALRDRDTGRLDAFVAARRHGVDHYRYEQFLFHQQWRQLRSYASARRVRLLGDVPIFPALDSADVWAHRSLFRLAPDGRPTVVAGVPPDYFSATGQRWGNPVYDWDAIAATDFRWWSDRIRNQLERFDLLRLDHFRGFDATWEIPAEARTAVEGAWRPVPGRALFAALARECGALPFVAEDLGVITPAVEALRRELGLPGMRVLQFAFDGDVRNPYLPHNHEPDALVCTGTHDNDTTLGWFQALDDSTRARVLDYLGRPAEPMPWPLVRAAFASVARLAVVPMQDLLGLGSEARMNTPGTRAGNWSWRLGWHEIPADFAPQVRALSAGSDRLPAAPT